MACVYPTCKLKADSDQQLLCCWLCDAHAHRSCAGFNGRQFDVIIDRSKGLRWSCLNCRDIEVDFYRLFRDAKLEISRLKADFAKVTVNFNKLESLFGNFEYADGSPKRKKSSLSLGRDICNNPPNASNLISLLSPAINGNFAPQSLPTVTETAPPVENFSNERGVGTSATLDDASAPCFSQDNVVPAGNVQDIVVPNISNSVSPQNGGRQNIPSLVVVPPRRTVFLSRLAPDTTIEEIVNYVKSSRPDIGEDVVVYKFQFTQQRDISSFKILVPGKYFDDIVQREFWPDGILVREFVHRERNRIISSVQLSSSNLAPKN